MSSRCSPGWITVPGKGKRWRTAECEYLMQRPAAGGVQGLLGVLSRAGQAVTRTYGDVDRRVFGGALPGGADSPVVGRSSSTTRQPAAGARPNGISDAMRAIQGAPAAIVRTPAFQGARDAVLDAVRAPLPERLFIQAMTGGVRDGVQSLPPEVMQSIRQGVVQRDDHYRDENEWAGRKGMPPVRQKSNVDLYQAGRDARLGLGNVGVWQQPGGNVLIKDRWKVDNPDVKTSGGVIPDLMEGGPAASAVFRAADRLGTYEPIDIQVVVPPEEWERIPRFDPSLSWRSNAPNRYQVSPTIRR